MGQKELVTSTNAGNSRILNLPIELHGLDCVGREQDLLLIHNLLLDSGMSQRVITVQGAGGSGKTTLMVEAGRRALSLFEGGVIFVAGNTIPALQPNLLFTQLANILKLKEETNRPVLDVLVNHLASRQVLLLLDNLEHLLPGLLPAFKDLLRRAPQTRVLVSSRQKLGLIPYEHLFNLAPLPTPALSTSPNQPAHNLAELAENPAVQIFLKQARSVDPDFALSPANAGQVVELVTQANGMPLAIGLTAVRSSLMSTRDVLSELQTQLNNALHTSATPAPAPTEAPSSSSPRSKPNPARLVQAQAASAVESTLEWSYNLLESDEKKLLRRLAVFVGGCTLEAIEQVCVLTGPGNSRDIYLDVEERLASLRRNGLLLARTGLSKAGGGSEKRYSLLEPVREFAWTQTQAQNEDELIQDRHAAYYLDLTRTAATVINGSEPEPGLRRMETEQPNLRAALAWTLNATSPNQSRLEIGLELAYKAWIFWKLRGYLSEAQHWLDLAVEKGQAEGFNETFHFAKALEARGYLARLHNDFSRARTLNEQALAIHRKLDNRLEIASSTSNLATVFNETGELDLAMELYEQSLAMHRELGDDDGIAVVLNNLAILWNRRGDYRRSLQMFQQSLELGRKIGSPTKIVVRLSNVAAVSEQLGDYAYAEECLKEAQVINEKLGYPEGVAMTASGLASLAILRQDYTAARNHNEKSLEIYRELGNLKATVEVLQDLGFIETEVRNYAKAFEFYRQACQVNQQLGNLPPEQIRLLEGLGHLTAHHSSALPNLVKAVQLYAVTQSLRDKLGIAPTTESVRDKRNHETLAHLRQKLSPQEFEQAWQSGLQLEAQPALEHGLSN